MSLNKEFIPIESTEFIYGINSEGLVKRLKLGQGSSGKELKSYCDTHGYLRVRLCLNGKSQLRYIHRLIAESFIPNPDGKSCVNHKDGNKLNNSISNPLQVTYTENTKHAVDSGLHQVGEACYNYKHGKYSKHKKETEVV